MAALARELKLAEAASDGRVITEAAYPYRITYVNDAWITVTGYSRDSIVGNTCKVLQGPDTCKRTLQVSTARHCRRLSCLWQ